MAGPIEWISVILKALAFLVSLKWAGWLWHKFLDACCKRPSMREKCEKHYLELKDKAHRESIATYKRILEEKGLCIEAISETSQSRNDLVKDKQKKIDALQIEKDEVEAKLDSIKRSAPEIIDETVVAVANAFRKAIGSYRNTIERISNERNEVIDRHVALARWIHIAIELEIQLTPDMMSSASNQFLHKRSYTRICKFLRTINKALSEDNRISLPGFSTIDIEASPPSSLAIELARAKKSAANSD